MSQAASQIADRLGAEAGSGAEAAGAPRILFVMSAYSGSTTGQGGHYYSARDVASVLQAEWPGAEVQILVLGDILPAAIGGGSLEYVHVSPAGKGLREYCREVLASAERLRPTIVHAHDNKSYFFARLIARRHRAKRFLTKPAGRDPRAGFPYCPDIVCYSAENLEALRSRRRLRASRVHLIPNRVILPAPAPERIAALRERIGPGDVLLRICRIGDYHRTSIEKTLLLARLMRTRGMDVRAVIIGALESRAVLESLRKEAGSGDLFVTEPAFTVDAAALLDLATFVVGTGRGVIEAAMRRRWVFVPVGGEASMPALVAPSNWRMLSATNFSVRSPDPRGAGRSDLSLLEELLADGGRAGAFLDELSTALGDAYGPVEIPARYADLYSREQETEAVERFDRVLGGASFALAYMRWLRERRRRGPAAEQFAATADAALRVPLGAIPLPTTPHDLSSQEEQERIRSGQPSAQ